MRMKRLFFIKIFPCEPQIILLREETSLPDDKPRFTLATDAEQKMWNQLESDVLAQVDLEFEPQEAA